MATIFAAPKVAGYATAFGVTELNDTDKGECFVGFKTYTEHKRPVAMTIPCLSYVGDVSTDHNECIKHAYHITEMIGKQVWIARSNKRKPLAIESHNAPTTAAGDDGVWA